MLGWKSAAPSNILMDPYIFCDGRLFQYLPAWLIFFESDFVGGGFVGSRYALPTYALTALHYCRSSQWA
jgi:hypothetical protein